jgi:putative oxidoreductase
MLVITTTILELVAGEKEREMGSNSMSVRSGPGTWSKSASGSATWTNTAVVVAGRVLFSLLFITSGLGHFSRQTIAYGASQGVPWASIAVPLSGLVALAGGLSILLGYRTRFGAWLIALFLVPVTLMMHKFWTVDDPMMAQVQQIMFLKNITMLGGALLITQFGAGPVSLDSYRER